MVACTYGNWHTFQASPEPGTSVVLQPGGELQTLCATVLPGGGSGTYSGTISVAEDRGAVQASGTVWSPQDTAAAAGWPNYVFLSTFFINGARPF